MKRTIEDVLDEFLFPAEGGTVCTNPSKIAAALRAECSEIRTPQDDTARTIADEILMIFDEYNRQNEKGHVDTPGGLEHMGDVWSLITSWGEMLRKVTP